MLQRQAQVELPRDAQRREDVVGLMGVGLQGDLTRQHRQQGLELLVVGGHFGYIAVGRLLAGAVVPRLHQRAAQERRRGHAGGIALVAVAALGVLAEGTFHGNRVAHDHFVHAIAHGFHGQKGAAKHVGAARAGADAGHAGPARVRQRRVTRVDAVDRAQLRRPDVVHLVVVAALVPDPIAIKADMGVGIDKTGINLQPIGVKHSSVCRGSQIGSDGGNFTVGQQNVSLAGVAVDSVMDEAAAYEGGHGYSSVIP